MCDHTVEFLLTDGGHSRALPPNVLGKCHVPTAEDFQVVGKRERDDRGNYDFHDSNYADRFMVTALLTRAARCISFFTCGESDTRIFAASGARMMNLECVFSKELY